MASNPKRKSVLIKASAATDVQYSGGDVSIAGLNVVSRKDITSIRQVKSRAEVSQVATISTTVAPAGSTKYTVAVYDPLRVQAGYTESEKTYSYTTTASLVLEGATAALQREYINVKIIALINADANNHSVAATLGTGTGFTVTDDAGYYPVFAQNMSNVRGASTVFAVTNGDGTGFATSVVSITTAAVYSFGLGANLLAEKPVVDFVYGNLISGIIDDAPVTFANPPVGATSGQNYDCFIIESMKSVDAIQATGQFAYVESIQRVFYDNGLGSATTNLALSKAFERVMHKLMVSTFAEDPNCVQEWFDKPYIMQANTGITPYVGTLAGTANVLDFFVSPYGALNHTNIGTQTIFAPLLDTTGLNIDQDDSATEGAHYSACQQTLCDQSFIVGKTAFMVVGRVVMADILNSHFQLGFRKKAAYTADYNDYTDLASIGTRVSGALGAIATAGILNNAATVNTVSSDVLVNAVSALFIVKVALDGTVTCKVNGTSYPVYSAGTTALIFDATDEMIPFFQHVNINSANAGVVISEFFAVANDNLIS